MYTEEPVIGTPVPILPEDNTDNSFWSDCFLFYKLTKINYRENKIFNVIITYILYQKYFFLNSEHFELLILHLSF